MKEFTLQDVNSAEENGTGESLTILNFFLFFLEELVAGTPEPGLGRKSGVCKLVWCVSPAHQMAER